jgi:putative ABC transport system permease protein
MGELRRLLLRLRNAMAPRRAEAELSREVSSHLQLLEDDYQRQGLAPEDARRAARRSLGGVEHARNQHRDARSLVWLDDLRRDTAYAVRTLLRSPGFTTPVVVTLALAIGASTAIFTVVDHVLLLSLPLPHADRLVRIYESNPTARRPRTDASVPNAADWRRASSVFEVLAPIGGTSVTITGAASAESLVGALVGPQFFDITGILPALGRIFEADEYLSLANAALGPVFIEEGRKPTGAASFLISHGVWQRQFGGDPNIVGRRVDLNGRPAVVAGVMPQNIWLAESGWGVPEVWIPLVESQMSKERRFRQFAVLARLKPGVDAVNAEANLKTAAAELEKNYPRDNRNWSVIVVPLQESIVGESRATLLIVLVGVGCVLLVAGANIANLFLMRAVGRTREVAVRMAVGAGRSRLVRQWLTESTLLACVSGLFGFLMATWAVPTLVSYAPRNLPRLGDIGLDWRVFGFCATLSIVTGLVAGLAPALAIRDVGVTAFRSSGAAAGWARRRWMRPALVVTQVALALVLLVGAGLMARTLMAVYSIDLGFDPRSVLSFGADLRNLRVAGLNPGRDFNRGFVERLSKLPGVIAAGTGTVPLVGGIGHRVIAEGVEQPISAGLDLPSPGYFKALGFRLRTGRFFSDHDGSDAEPVVIVNQTFARTAWGTTDVVGRRIRGDQDPSTWMTIVGVVDDIRRVTLEAEAPPLVFVPYLQPSIATAANYVVKTETDPVGMIPAIRDLLRSIDPSIPLTRVAMMEERVSNLLGPRHFNLWLLGLFSLVAVTLAAVGIYGLVNESVTSRTAEIGVRMTLGAGAGAIVRLVVGRSLIVTALGIVVGLGVAVMATHWLGSMLFGVTPLDPVTLAAVPLIFVAIAALAAFAPSRRATRVDPVIALRGE